MTDQIAVLEGPSLGEGIYTFGEAALILQGVTKRVTTRQLHYWMDTGLTPASHESSDGVPVLTFEDLISLEIVRRFRQKDVSLQSIRRVEAELRDDLQVERPFAYEVFFTDGANVWAQLNGEEGLAREVVGQRKGHYVWTEVIRSFAHDIRFAGDPARASKWHLSPWVEIDPAVQFGTPVIAGTRIPVRTIVANLEAGSPAEVADWYGLRREQVEGAQEYLAAH